VTTRVGGGADDALQEAGRRRSAPPLPTTAPLIGGGAATPDGTPSVINGPAPPPTTPDVLRHAAELLRDRGLCQGTTFAENGRAGLDGALWLAAGAADPTVTGWAGWADSLSGDVMARYYAACNALSGRCGGVGVPQIGDFWVRTTDEAVALLEATADDLERETAPPG
jgi:hypothetical protein